MAGIKGRLTRLENKIGKRARTLWRVILPSNWGGAKGAEPIVNEFDIGCCDVFGSFGVSVRNAERAEHGRN